MSCRFKVQRMATCSNEWVKLELKIPTLCRIVFCIFFCKYCEFSALALWRKLGQKGRKGVGIFGKKKLEFWRKRVGIFLLMNYMCRYMTL